MAFRTAPAPALKRPADTPIDSPPPPKRRCTSPPAKCARCPTPVARANPKYCLECPGFVCTRCTADATPDFCAYHADELDTDLEYCLLCTALVDTENTVDTFCDTCSEYVCRDCFDFCSAKCIMHSPLPRSCKLCPAPLHSKNPAYCIDCRAFVCNTCASDLPFPSNLYCIPHLAAHLFPADPPDLELPHTPAHDFTSIN